MAPVNLGYTVLHPQQWLDWTDKTSLIRFIYYGGSAELLFILIETFILITVIGVWKRKFLWMVVRALEGFANGVGRVAAWAGLIMVLQQVIVVFLQRVFTVAQISVGPFG
ncbi:MAG: C4-dicarboxylate ABC transporter permease, partial [Rhodobacteraceae bacterium]|nr:C4-dicarboxylate ABC transporter permease [Paracoccaceae bacterium]